MRAKVKPTRHSQVDQRRWLFIGVVSWFVVAFIRPQDMVSAIKVLPLGYLSLGLILVGLLKIGDYRRFRDRSSVLHLCFLVVVVLGYFKAVNTFWLFHYFLTLTTYWIVFCIAVPMVMEVAKYRDLLIKLMFVVYAVLGVWVLTHGGRGQGAFLGDENDAALALGVGFALCFPLRSVYRTKAGRSFASLALALCVVGIVATMSRGGFIGLVAALLAVALFSGRMLKTLSMTLLFAVLALPLVPDRYVTEVQSIDDPSESTRVQRMYMWRIGLQAYMSNPILGIGVGNYAYRVADYEKTEFVQKANIFGRSFAGRSVHSTYFQVLPEVGTLGALIFVVMAWRVLRNGIRFGVGNRAEDDRGVALARGTSAGMVVFLASGAFLSAAYYPHFWMLCGFSASIGSVQPWIRSNKCSGNAMSVEKSTSDQCSPASTSPRVRRRYSLGSRRN
jgi:O-antigen ligase